MTAQLTPVSIGLPLARLDAVAKVTGSAPYAHDHVLDRPAHLFPIQATIARGRIIGFDTAAAEQVDGVLLIITHHNAPRLVEADQPELMILQGDEISYRGQLIGGVVATTPEAAREAADLVRVDCAAQSHDARLAADRDDLYAPTQVNGGHDTDTEHGDVDTALAEARFSIDQTYTTPMEHNNPMEPHTTVARWGDDGLILHDSTQGVHSVRATVATMFDLPKEQVRVVSPYVGGGFGSKGAAHSHDILVVSAARLLPGRSIKLALTRQQMFFLVGHRPPTISRVALAATRNGELTAIVHEAVSQTARVQEFAEQTAVPSRTVYGAPNRRTRHRLAKLDVPVPFWMRAPGECPGMFGPEVAMDELAELVGIDPVELRIRNDTDTDPDTGKPFSHRDLVGCLRAGAHRFGWAERPAEAGTRRDGEWRVGFGVASSTYPALTMPGTVARIRHRQGRYRVEVGAADIGTGTWTALSQIAADALGCRFDQVDLQIGDTDLPMATVEGGSSGISSWGSAVVAVARRFRAEHGNDPDEGARSEGTADDNPALEQFAPHSFGAQFAEVRVNAVTGEVRVPRMLGVFSVGQVINPATARSQLVGGMVMGLSMALHEHSVMDHHLGQVVNHDLVQYHIAAHADVADVDAIWLDERDPVTNPMGSRGIGEIGIVGTAAAIANATHNATGLRVRDLPLTPDLFAAGTEPPVSSPA